ncbi:hypothetical protein AB1L30_07555 [Bremerella sp. JC817]|uniref:beta strand repeat-containing protein n=1 Tax=Bremerella sp. JC817 TaxID=3231756 RepID=UPI00345B0F6E
MKKKSFWKRIFGEAAQDKRPQQAFQDQFDTKLRFRELEPRVVLAAATLDMAGNLNVTIDDGDMVTIGRDGSGNLTISGINSLNINGVVTAPSAGDTTTFALTSFQSVSFDAGLDAASLSQLIFADSLGDLSNSFSTGDVSVSGIDQVDLGKSMDPVTIGGDLLLSNAGNMDNSTIGLGGSTVLEGNNLVLDEITGDLDVDLNDAPHDFSTIIGTGSDVAYQDANDIDVGGLTVDSLELSAGGSIQQLVGGIAVAGDTKLTAGTDITLDQAGNNWTGKVEAEGQNVTLVSHTGSIVLGEVTASQLEVTANGSISQVNTGEAISVSGATKLTLTGAGDIDLRYGTNQFTGGMIVDGSALLDSFYLRDDNATAAIPGSTVPGEFEARLASGGMTNVSLLFENAPSLDLPEIKLAGNLNVSIGGDLTQSGKLDIDGTTSIRVADTGNVTLLDGNNEFTGAISVQGLTGSDRAGTVQILGGVGDLTLGKIYASQLNVTSAAKIEQTTDGIDVSNSSVFQAGTNQDIVLDGPNVFGDAVSAHAGVDPAGIVEINVASGDLTLGAINAMQLDVTGAAAIDQTSDGITVSGAATLTTTGSITLDQFSNNFQNQVNLTGTTVTLFNGGAITLGNVSASDLEVEAQTGDIAQAPGTSLLVTGTTQVAVADTFNLLLNEAGNDFGGAVSVESAGTPGTVSIRDANALLLGAIEADIFSALAGTSISQQAGTAIQADTSVTLEATTSGITLGEITTGTLIATTNAGNIDASATAPVTATTLVQLNTTSGTISLGNLQTLDLVINSGSGGGGISQIAATTLDVNGTTVITIGGNLPVTLFNDGNDFTGAVSILGNGVADIAGTVMLKDDNAIVLGDVEAGILIAEATGNIGQASGTSLQVNDTISLTTDAAIELGNVTTNTLKLTATGGVTQAAMTSIDISGITSVVVGAGAQVDLSATNNKLAEISVAGSGGTAAGQVDIVDSDGDLQLNQMVVDKLTVSTVGSLSQMAATSIDATATVDSFVDLTAGGTISLRGITTPMLSLDGGGSVTQASGELVVSGMTTVVVATGANVDLSAAANEFGSIGVEGTGSTAAGQVDIVDSTGDLQLKDFIVDKLTVSTTGNLDQADMSSIDATASLGSFVDLTAGGTISLRGITTEMLSLTAGGTISQASGELIVAGMTTVEVATGANVDLSAGTNEFGSIGVTGAGGTAAGTVTIVDSSGDLELKDFLVDKLTASTAGNLTQMAATSVDATATVDSLVDLTASGTISLRGITSAALALTAGGDITQASDQLIITGATTVEIATGQNVDLSVGSNEFGSIGVTGAGGTAAGEVKVTDSSGDLELLDFVVDKLTVETPGALSQADLTSIDATASAGSQVDLTAGQTITLRGLETVTLSLTAGNDISQASDELKVLGTTTVLVATGANVDLSSATNALGTIGVEGFGGTAAGEVTIVDSDAGLVLTDFIVDKLTASVTDSGGALSQMAGSSIDATQSVDSFVELNADGTITLEAITTPTLTLRANDTISQSGGQLEVTGIATIEVADGVTVLLDKTTNNFGLVSINSGLVDRAGVVDIVDGIDAIELLDIRAADFSVTANGDITQAGGTALDISTQTTLALTTKATIELLNVGNDMSANVILDLGGSDNLLFNFEIRNENVDVIDTPGGDFDLVAKAGTIGDLTLELVNAKSLTLSEIDITNDLRVEIAGDLDQDGEISVANDATFDAGSITFATVNNLTVVGQANFDVDNGDLRVGVLPTTSDSFLRGLDAPTIVSFGSLQFQADGMHVTISEDDANGILLVGDSVAKSLVLTANNTIENQAGSSLSVADLTSLKTAAEVSLQGDVDLRILYAEAQKITIDEQADTNGLAIIDGTRTTAGGSIHVRTDGSIVQVNDFRIGNPGASNIIAHEGLFISEGGAVLLTSLDVDWLAASAEGTPLNVTPGSSLDFAAAGINVSDGFNGSLTTDAIDPLLPDENSDTYAAGGLADKFADGVGEDYSLVLVNRGDLVIRRVDGAFDDPVSVNGLVTAGSDAGHVFLRTIDGGALTFGAAGSDPVIVDLANSGIITALAEGSLQITAGFELHSSQTNLVDPMLQDLFAIVAQIQQYNDILLPNPADQLFEIIDGSPNEGPIYVRIPGTTTTYLLSTAVGLDAEAFFVISQLGASGELDFRIVVDWGDGTALDIRSFDTAIDSNTAIEHAYAWEFATSSASVTVTVRAYNSPQINLYENVGTPNEQNLNFVQDKFQFFFNTIPFSNYQPVDFVPPNAPLVEPSPIIEAEVVPYSSLPKINDDARAATQIDGVTVVEVDPRNFEEVGEEIELGSEYMTLDAVKALILNGDQFPPGLYRISILYPGVEEPQIHYFWKEDRPVPFDLFSQNDSPAAATEAELAVASTANSLSAEDVWAREYEEWFPDADPVASSESATEEQLPSEDDILMQRVAAVDLQEIDRLTQQLRAKRMVARDCLGGAMIGGAALMAAVASQRQEDEKNRSDSGNSENPDPPEDLGVGNLARLRRRARQWLD